MTPFLRKLLGLNWLLLVLMLALAIFGVVAIYSATYMREDPVSADFWRKQANWVAVGFFAFMVASLIDYRWIRWGALPMYLAGLFFLILTKFMGQKVYGPAFRRRAPVALLGLYSSHRRRLHSHRGESRFETVSTATHHRFH